MSYLPKLGSYTFPPTITVRNNASPYVVSAAKLPRAHGAKLSTAYKDKRVFSMEGGLIDGFGGDTLREQLDALSAACAVGDTTFQLTSDRFFRNAYVENFEFPQEATWADYLSDVSLEVVCGDPFEYDSTLNSSSNATLPTPISAAGNAFSLPVLSLTIGGSGAEDIDFIFENETTGELFTLVGSVNAGQVIVVNSLLQTVTITGVDRMDLFDGQFWKLAVGSNILSRIINDGSISNYQIQWYDRYF